MVGELGEYANLRKKVERGDFTIEHARPMLADELADVVIYLDHLAAQIGVDLGEAVMSKWNRTSEKVGAPLYIDAEDWHYTRILEPQKGMMTAMADASGKLHHVLCTQKDGHEGYCPSPQDEGK